MGNFKKHIHPLLRKEKPKGVYDDTNYAVINALDTVLDEAEKDTLYSKIQSSLKTAKGEFLDVWGDWFGIGRRDKEDDEHYRQHIIDHTLVGRGTIETIQDAIRWYFNDKEAVVNIYEPWRDIFYTNKSKLNGYACLMGYYYRFAIIDITVDRPYKDDIMDIIQSFKPAGVKFYVRYDRSLSYKARPLYSPFSLFKPQRYVTHLRLTGRGTKVYGDINTGVVYDSTQLADIFRTNNSALNGPEVLSGKFRREVNGEGLINMYTTSMLDIDISNKELYEIKQVTEEYSVQDYKDIAQPDEKYHTHTFNNDDQIIYTAYADNNLGTSGFSLDAKDKPYTGYFSVSEGVNLNLMEHSKTSKPELFKSLRSKQIVTATGQGTRIYGTSSTTETLGYLYAKSSVYVAEKGILYAFSVKIKNNDKSGTITVSTGLGKSVKVKPGKEKLIKMTSVGDGINLLGFTFNTFDDTAKNIDFEYYNPKIELGDSVTPWAPNKLDNEYYTWFSSKEKIPKKDGIYYDYVLLDLRNSIAQQDPKGFYEVTGNYTSVASAKDFNNYMLKPYITTALRIQAPTNKPIEVETQVYDNATERWSTVASRMYDVVDNFVTVNTTLGSVGDYITSTNTLGIRLKLTDPLFYKVETKYIGLTYVNNIDKGYEISTNRKVSHVSIRNNNKSLSTMV